MRYKRYIWFNTNMHIEPVGREYRFSMNGEHIYVKNNNIITIANTGSTPSSIMVSQPDYNTYTVSSESDYYLVSRGKSTNHMTIEMLETLRDIQLFASERSPLFNSNLVGMKLFDNVLNINIYKLITQTLYNHVANMYGSMYNIPGCKRIDK